MSQRNVKIPDKLPPIEKGIELFRAWRDAPSKLLCGVVPLELFKGPFLDIDRVWFVGSCAWMPLVLGRKFDDKSDVDVCFADRDQAKDFVKAFVDRMEGTVFVGQTTNRFGGPKIFRSSKLVGGHSHAEITDEIMDVLWLPPSGRTIAEVISAFAEPHERVAIVASAQPGDLSAVTRIVRPWEHKWMGPGAPDHRAECYACNRTFEDHQAKKKKDEAEAAARRAEYDWS